MKDLALFIVRSVAGGLMAGHGAQKLFGWFDGPGIEGTSGFMESLGLRPGHKWAYLAGLSEFSGGSLTALGLGGPLGPLGIIGAMTMATAKAHWDKPIWVTSGGAELPVVYSAIAAAVMVAGPGKLSVDHALGIKLPRWLVMLAVITTVAAAVSGIKSNPEEDGESAQE